MISKTIEKALNDQIVREFDAANTYLAMSVFFSTKQLDGVAHFYRVQYQEETMHALKMVDYVLQSGGTVIIAEQKKPKASFSSLLEAFKASLAHEKANTKGIHGVVDLALKEKDHGTRVFFDWFVTEQIEEESSFEALINKVGIIGEKGQGLYLLDQEMGQRPLPTPITTPVA
jgi:ferritin